MDKSNIMADELDAPLGQKKKRLLSLKALPPIDMHKLPLARIGFGVLAIVLAAVIARIALVDDPQGGRPSAEISIATNSGANQLASEVSLPPAGQGIVETDTPDPALPADGTPDSADDSPMAQPATGIAALNEFGVLPELIEETAIGTLPRTSDTGETPFAAYARASISVDSSNDKPLIAIIVTGMGLSEGGTMDAIDKLPDNITLAFAPYGRTLKTTTTAARNGGHELLLELPLEPFDYPENDPGPQTLLTGQPPRANLDRMFWLMARLGGYIGVINHMGARFTTSATDFNPIMEELALRGLGYVDDGSSNRSIARQLAQTNQVPFARASKALDDTPSRAAILTALDALEVAAKENGRALGVASALPVSVQTIADWANKLEEKGILLVPASALMAAKP